MRGFSVIVLCLFSIKFTNGVEMVFEFGADVGDVIYSKDGNIPLFQYDTEVVIPVPQNYGITYIKVTVDSFSPPKVYYDDSLQKITMKFTWTQIAVSSYNIVVKGGPLMAP